MSSLLHTPLPLFLAQSTAIIVVARLLGLAARRLGQPMVVAEMLAGIVLGPSLLGALLPGVASALFPAASLGVLGIVSQIGLVLFMFLIGLELDPRMIHGHGRSTLWISNASIVAPFGLGALLALWLYAREAPVGVERIAFVTFLATAMSITAFPVLARILSERRLLGTRVGSISLACAAVGDVTAWCILAFVVSIARATSLGHAAITAGLAIVFVAVMLKVVKPLAHRLIDRVTTRNGVSQNGFAAVLLLVFASASLTEIIGIHALFGAFVFGAILPKDTPFASYMSAKLDELIVVFMLPLFFAFSGLRTQVGLVSTPGAWVTCALIILVACLGKFGGSALAARFTGLPWRESAAIGILMNTRGLMELIVLNVGLDLGVISPTLFTMMVLMALATTFVTSPWLAWVYPLAAMRKDGATGLSGMPPSSLLPLPREEQRPP